MNSTFVHDPRPAHSSVLGTLFQRILSGVAPKRSIEPTGHKCGVYPIGKEFRQLEQPHLPLLQGVNRNLPTSGGLRGGVHERHSVLPRRVDPRIDQVDDHLQVHPDRAYSTGQGTLRKAQKALRLGAGCYLLGVLVSCGASEPPVPVDCGTALERSHDTRFPYVIILGPDSLPLAVACNKESWESMVVGEYFCGERIPMY